MLSDIIMEILIRWNWRVTNKTIIWDVFDLGDAIHDRDKEKSNENEFVWALSRKYLLKRAWGVQAEHKDESISLPSQED